MKCALKLLLLVSLVFTACKKNEPFIQEDFFPSTSGELYYIVSHYTPFEEGGYGVDFIELKDPNRKTIVTKSDSPEGLEIAMVLKITKDTVIFQCIKPDKKTPSMVTYKTENLEYDLKTGKFK